MDDSIKNDVQKIDSFLKYIQEQSMNLRQLIQMVMDQNNMILLTGEEVYLKPKVGNHKVQMASNKLIKFAQSDLKMATMSIVKWSAIRLSYILGCVNLSFHIIATMVMVFKENLRVKHIIEPLKSIANELKNKIGANTNLNENVGKMEENYISMGNNLYVTFLVMLENFENQESNTIPIISKEIDNAFFDILNIIDTESGSTIIMLNLLLQFESGDLRRFIMKKEGIEITDDEEQQDDDVLVNFDERASSILYDIQRSNQDFENKVVVYETALVETKHKMKDLNDSLKSVVGSGDNVDKTVVNKSDGTAFLKKEIIEEKIKLLKEHLESLGALKEHEEYSDQVRKDISVTKQLIKKQVGELGKLEQFADTNLERIGLRFTNEKLWEMVKYENEAIFGKNNKHMSLLIKLMEFEMSSEIDNLTPVILTKISNVLKARFVENQNFSKETQNYLPPTSPFFYGKVLFWYVLLSVFLRNIIDQEIYSGRKQLLFRLLLATSTRYSNVPTWTRYDILEGDVDNVVIVKRGGAGRLNKHDTAFKKFTVVPNMMTVIFNSMNRIEDTKSIVSFIKSTDKSLSDEQVFVALIMASVLKGQYGLPQNKLSKNMFSELIRINDPLNQKDTLVVDKPKTGEIFNAFQSVSDDKSLLTATIDFVKKIDINKIINKKNTISVAAKDFVKQIEDNVVSDAMKSEMQQAVKNLDSDDIESIFDASKILSDGNERKAYVLFALGVIYLGKFGATPLPKDDFSKFIRLHDPNDKMSFLGDMKFAKHLFDANQSIQSLSDEAKPLKILRYINYMIAPNKKGFPPTFLNVNKILKPKT